jgi:hypothetical protein
LKVLNKWNASSQEEEKILVLEAGGLHQEADYDEPEEWPNPKDQRVQAGHAKPKDYPSGRTTLLVQQGKPYLVVVWCGFSSSNLGV